MALRILAWGVIIALAVLFPVAFAIVYAFGIARGWWPNVV